MFCYSLARQWSCAFGLSAVVNCSCALRSTRSEEPKLWSIVLVFWVPQLLAVALVNYSCLLRSAVSSPINGQLFVTLRFNSLISILSSLGPLLPFIYYVCILWDSNLSKPEETLCFVLSWPQQWPFMPACCAFQASIHQRQWCLYSMVRTA